MDPVQEIKLRLPIEEVVARYVSLKKAGRSLKGLCPFHAEKTPSFIVSPDKGLAYCFGCQKGGDLFRFVMEVEHVDFRGALEMLADQAGVVLPDTTPEARHEKTLILDLQKKAMIFFQKMLRGTEGVTAREVLAKRGVTAEMVDRFSIGAAPAAWDALTNDFTAHGHSQPQLVTAGLAIRRDEARDGVYDRFRSRLMFPLKDVSGRILGFTGRTLDGTEPKYLNSPESAAFSKGTYLYGMDLARDAIKAEDRVLVVEGQMDVIACHQFGITFTVATSGTALTEHHIVAMSKLTRHILFCYDADTAGVNASLKGLQMALNLGLDARAVVLPTGKDPDEALRADEAGVRAALANPTSASEYLLRTLKARHTFSDETQKHEAIEEFYAFVKGIGDPIVVGDLLMGASGVFGVRENYFREGYERYRSLPSYARAAQPALEEGSPMSPEEYLLGLLIERPALFPVVAAKARGGEIFSAEARRFYDVIAGHMEEHPEAETKDLLEAFPEDMRPRMEFVLLAVDEDSAPGSEVIEQELRTITDRLVKEFARRRNREISAALKSASPDEARLLTEELQLLLTEVHR